MAVHDDAFVDERYRPPLIRFNYPRTGIIVGVLGFSSLGLAMSIASFWLGLLGYLPKVDHLPHWAQIAIIVAILLSHLASVVGCVAIPLYGLARSGDVAAVLIRGRRFHGLRLGMFYLACFAAPWLVYACVFLSRG